MVACIRFGSEAFFLRSFGSMKPLGWFWHGFGKGFGREPQGRRFFRARKRGLRRPKRGNHSVLCLVLPRDRRPVWERRRMRM